MAKVLTTAAVTKYVPHPTRREIPDAKCAGLFLIVQPSGVKSWALRFRRPDGRSAKLTLGRVDLAERELADEPTLGAPLTLGMARELAARINRQRARGEDVVEQHKTRKHRERAAAAQQAANSFGAAAVEFFRDYRTKRGLRSRRWRGDARLLGLDWPRDCDPAKVEPKIIPGGLADIWATKPVAAIDGHDVHTLIDEARRHGIPGLPRHNKGVSEARGRKMHAALSVLFRWLLRHRRVAANPTVGVWHSNPPAARARVLDEREIRLVWRACDEIDPRYGALIRNLLLTGARLREVAGMRRAEISDDGMTWTIPGERTKNHREHAVPLAPLARELLAVVPAAGDYVFGARPPTGFSRAKAQLDAAVSKLAGAPIERWVLHDLRRTAASGMQRLGVRVEVIERALNHASGSYRGVAGIYQRDPMTDEVRTALERWAAHLTGVVSGEKATVTPIRHRGA